MSDQVHLLKTKRFLPLFITQFLGAFNDNAFKNAFLIWFTYDIAEKSGLDAPMMVNFAAGLFILPFFLFSATAGQIADKYEKSWLVQKIKIVEIVLMVGCSVGFYMHSISFLLVILFLMGVQSTFFGPIKYSLLPEHLKEGELISGNGLIEAGTFLSILLGTIFGGIVVRINNGIEAISFAVILFSILGWMSSRSIPKAPVGDKNLNIGWNIFKETWQIVKYAQEERTVWLSIIGVSWFWVIGATFLTQFPVYTQQVIGGNEHIVTLFLTLFSIGVGIGSALCNKLLRGEINGKWVPFGNIGMTIFIIDFFLASQSYSLTAGENIKLMGVIAFFSTGLQSYRIVFDLLMLSIFSGIYIVPLYAIIQHRSNEKFLARIIAANNMVNALFMVLASVGAVLLFSLEFNVKEVLLSVGIANIPVYFIVRKAVNRRLKYS